MYRKGDSVYVLKGSNVPLLLRSNGDETWRVVGECFIHGLMDGEAMAASERKEFIEVDVVLC